MKNECPYCHKEMISLLARQEISKLCKLNNCLSTCANPGGQQFDFNFGRIQISAYCDECDLIDFKEQLNKLIK